MNSKVKEALIKDLGLVRLFVKRGFCFFFLFSCLKALLVLILKCWKAAKAKLL